MRGYSSTLVLELQVEFQKLVDRSKELFKNTLCTVPNMKQLSDIIGKTAFERILAMRECET